MTAMAMVNRMFLMSSCNLILLCSYVEIFLGYQLEGKEQVNLGDVLKFLIGARSIPLRRYMYHKKLSFSFIERAMKVNSCFGDFHYP